MNTNAKSAAQVTQAKNIPEKDLFGKVPSPLAVR
jgi:hypothetical protein